MIAYTLHIISTLESKSVQDNTIGHSKTVRKSRSLTIASEKVATTRQRSSSTDDKQHSGERDCKYEHCDDNLLSIYKGNNHYYTKSRNTFRPMLPSSNY